MTNSALSLPPIPRVLSIAGTDPTGGAGIQADIKAIGEAGGYAMTVVTALVSQNTQGVREIHTPDTTFLISQLDAVFSDVTVDAVKIGMLGTTDITLTVTDYLRRHPVPLIVVDPVMVATSGDRLLTPDAEVALAELCRLADVITPNLAELAALADTNVADNLAEAIDQGRDLAHSFGTTVIVKGGHLSGSAADNAVVSPDGEVYLIPVARVDTKNTHGTGCSLSSAVTTRLAAGESVIDAVTWATRWLTEAIRYADDLHIGQGNGPVDHTHRSRRLVAAANTTPWVLSASIPDALETPADLTGEVSAEIPPQIPAAGPWTRALWDTASALYSSIIALPFIIDLGSGTLPRDDFAFYLAQDAVYLSHYSPALAALAASAPNSPSALFWVKGAAECLEEEAELHRNWLGDAPAARPSPITASYVSHLTRCVSTRDHVVGVSAVLPCYWLYAEVGLELASTSEDSNPYISWLNTYSDPAFVKSVGDALTLVEKAFEDASPARRAEAARAFLDAARWEVEFFDQASRRV